MTTNPLNLVKRSESAGPLTQPEHDQNLTDIEDAVNAKQDKPDPVETTETAITIDDTRANKNLILTATSAITVTLGNSTSDNAFGVITEGAQETTVVVDGSVQYFLKRDNLTGAGRTASFKIRGVIGWQVFRLAGGTDRRYLIHGDTDHDQDIRNVTIFGYRSHYEELSGTQTLSATVAPAGSTRANTGAAATWTLPSRITSVAGGQQSESIVVYNFGSGTITFSASGPTPIPTTLPTLAANQAATIEWCRKGTGTERVVVKVG